MAKESFFYRRVKRVLTDAVIQGIGGCNTLKVKIISHTPNPDMVCAAAAMGCYSEHSSDDLLGRLDAAKAKSVLQKTVSSGHHSVIEHAVFTFSISGVSRALTHQLVRHRMASYSQQSQRYVRTKKPDFVLPPTIASNDKLAQVYKKYMHEAWALYNHMIISGIVEEDARFVLPNAATTKITVTMNARELIAFFRLRLCLHSQWEIRHLAQLMLSEAKKAAPAIFSKAGPACAVCPEGDIKCPRNKKHR